MLNHLMAHLAVRVEDLKDREDGQGMIEYALLAVFISIAAIAALVLIGPQVLQIFTDISNAL